MNVTWYFDYAPTGGSVADGGADAKVTVVPSRGQTFWESARWDVANGKFSAGAKPAGAEDSGGVTWTLVLADLGIPKPATLRVWAVSLYKSYNGLGTLLSYSDTAGPGSVVLSGPIPDRSGPVNACRRAIGKANGLQQRIRKAKQGKGKSARQRLSRLRAKRKRALKAMAIIPEVALVVGGEAGLAWRRGLERLVRVARDGVVRPVRRCRRRSGSPARANRVQ